MLLSQLHEPKTARQGVLPCLTEKTTTLGLSLSSDCMLASEIVKLLPHRLQNRIEGRPMLFSNIDEDINRPEQALLGNRLPFAP